MVLCPTKCVVASYLLRSAKTGASASRDRNSCEGVGSLAFMYTTKWVSAVKSDIWPFASRRSAQCAYASTSSRIARRSATSVGEIASCVMTRGWLSSQGMLRFRICRIRDQRRRCLHEDSRLQRAQLTGLDDDRAPRGGGRSQLEAHEQRVGIPRGNQT